ncbi:MAG: hypothetical protein J5616_01005 [Bacteroidaceae bacterium]|nr:hypothetical protein [Bacteroidaceae bacterium]
MKKMLLLGLMLAASIGLSAQDLNVCTKDYGEFGSVTVIKPTIANLLTLLSLDSEQFEAVMRKNQYEGSKMSDDYLAYWNGSNDNFAYAKAVNAFLYNLKKKEVHFSVSTEMVYPQGSIVALYKALKPYYKETLPGDGGRMGNAPGPRPDEGARPGARPDRPGRRGLKGRSRTDIYEVKDDTGTYIFSIGSFPRFFYVVVNKEE